MPLVWLGALAAAAVPAVDDPRPMHVAAPALLAVSFVVTVVHRRLSERYRHRSLRDLERRLDMASYLDEFQSLPNRNYLLDQLRREMPRARHTGEPFVLVIVTASELEAIADRRGPDFASLAARSLARLIERFTRASDFAAELGPGAFAVLLYECDLRMAKAYLRRVPGSLAVSTGKQMLEIPLTVRVSEYDMESVYAIDVLREAEEAPPARAADGLRHGAEAA
jgi:diguanylate cyclase (GGDEF)-like protein